MKGQPLFAATFQALRRAFAFQLMALFLPLALLVNGVGFYIYQTKKNEELNIIRKSEAANIKTGEQPIINVFGEITHDILYLAQSYDVRRFAENPTPEATHLLAEDMINLSRTSRIYDKVRWLDETGMERIRVNFNDGSPTIVPAGQLQNKGNRYFFTDVYRLNAGEVYISPFDLNVENNQLEIPYKPTIRIGTPVSDSHGKKRGIVLLNYLGAKLTARFSETISDAADHIMLLNRDGYWLKSPRPEDEWGFMLKRDNLTLARSHPAAWQRIVKENTGQFEDADGLWTFDTVRPLTEGQKTSSGTAEIASRGSGAIQDYEYQWKVVSHLPQGILYKNINSLRNLLLIGDTAFMLLLFAVSWVMVHLRGQHIADTERILNLAFYDPLTHLPNRRLLLDRLRQALGSSARSARRGALLFIDLDNFKTLNDTLGHDMGDLLLQQVAQRLQSCVREGDTVSRLGGDEFVVMLEDLSAQAHEAAAQTEAVGEKILATLNRAYLLAAHEYRSTPSIGATLFVGQQQTLEELLKQADIAMYQAKEAGRNALRFFDPQMQATINANAALKSELLTALEQRQLHLYYQVQVDSAHRPLGAEALIRWAHPERGLIPPAQFIALAEESGLMLPIGQWVLETACAQIKSWQQDALTRDLILAVNVSTRQFLQADFVERVRAAIQRHGINPKLLKLELTESLLLENIENTIATMTALSKAGVRFSLDDFGTGYSFLQYLKRLPLDQLKIDKLFIRGIATDRSDSAVVHAIIAMAQNLNMDVIAEGVETEEQRQLLLDKGCIHYQGHLFGKPVPIEQFEAMLRQTKLNT